MYRLSDKAQKLLKARAVKRFSKAKGKLQQVKFDELNVIKEMKVLYEELEQDNEEILLELAQKKYAETNPEGVVPNRKWLLALLALSDPVSKFVYLNEVPRKAERTAEAINAVGAKTKQMEIGLRYWASMTDHYADVVTDAAVLDAYRDTGVKFVRWITAEDDRVCHECEERDGQIYPINNIPPKPHYGCRCRYAPEKAR